jgi:hypothetical protein
MLGKAPGMSSFDSFGITPDDQAEAFNFVDSAS